MRFRAHQTFIGLSLLFSLILISQPSVVKAEPTCADFGGRLDFSGNACEDQFGAGWVQAGASATVCAPYGGSCQCCIPEHGCSGTCRNQCLPDETPLTASNAWCDGNTPYPICCALEFQIDCDTLSGLPGYSPFKYPKCAFEELGVLATWMMTYGAVAAGILALVFILYGGFFILTAQDDPERREKGQKTVTWAVIGVFLAVSAFILIRLADQLLNINAFAYGPVRAWAQTEEVTAVSEVQVTGRVYDALTNEILPGADVYLYWKNEGKWEIWPGKDFNNQRNPQKVDSVGEYLFFVTPGDYYVKVNSSGYYSKESDSFRAESQPVRQNIYLDQASTVWKIILAIGSVILVVGVGYIALKGIIIWNKKQQIKRMVLKHVEERQKEAEEKAKAAQLNRKSPQQIREGTKK